MWIAIGIVLIGVVAAFAWFRQRGDEISNLGSVSDRWVAEHRLGQSHN